MVWFQYLEARLARFVESWTLLPRGKQRHCVHLAQEQQTRTIADKSNGGNDSNKVCMAEYCCPTTLGITARSREIIYLSKSQHYEPAGDIYSSLC